MIRTIRIELITAALWLAWAIITPIDWMIEPTARGGRSHEARARRSPERDRAGSYSSGG